MFKALTGFQYSTTQYFRLAKQMDGPALKVLKPAPKS
jgi:hypothetical protein